MKFKLSNVVLKQAWHGLVIGCLMGTLVTASAGDTTPAAQLERFKQASGTTPNAQRGKSFFVTRHQGEWSCSSCHGEVPNRTGKHTNTGKLIEPLAPSANPQAFTMTNKVDKWFKRNCNDVLSRECTAQEKADVLAYLISIK